MWFRNRKRLFIIITILSVSLLALVPIVVIASRDEPDTMDIGNQIFISDKEIEKLRGEPTGPQPKPNPKPGKENQPQPYLVSQVEGVLKEQSLSQRLYGTSATETPKTSTPIVKNTEPTELNSTTPKDALAKGDDKSGVIPGYIAAASQENPLNSNSKEGNEDPRLPRRAKGNHSPALPSDREAAISAEVAATLAQSEPRPRSRRNLPEPVSRNLVPEEGPNRPLVPHITYDDQKPLISNHSLQTQDPVIQTTQDGNLGIASYQQLNSQDPLVTELIQLYSGEGKTNFLLSVERMRKYFPIIRKIIKEQGLPEVLTVLPLALSAYNPGFASQKEQSGIWQLRPYLATAYQLKMNSDLDERKDIETGTRAALQHLKTLYRVFKDWDLAIAALAAGSGYVTDKIAEMGTRKIWDLSKDRHFREQSNDDLPRFHALVSLIQHPTSYGLTAFHFSDSIPYQKMPLPAGESIHQITKNLAISRGDLMFWNPELIGSKLPSHQTHHTLKLPKNSIQIAKRWYQPKPNPNFQDPVETLTAGVGTSPIAITQSDLLAQIPDPESLPLPIQSAYAGDNPILREVPEEPFQQYVVQGGDHLPLVAQKFRVDVKDILEANHLVDENQLAPGLVLRIPTSSHFSDHRLASSTGVLTYEVQEGDSLIKIATDHRVRLQDLYEANRGLNERIRIGQKLVIPPSQLTK